MAEDASQLLTTFDRLTGGEGSVRKRKTGSFLSVFTLGHCKYPYQHKPDSGVALQGAADSEHSICKKVKDFDYGKDGVERTDFAGDDSPPVIKGSRLGRVEAKLKELGTDELRATLCKR